MAQSWLQHTLSALSHDAKTSHTVIKGAPCETRARPPFTVNCSPHHRPVRRFWGRRGSTADFQTAFPAPLHSMSMGIRVTSLKFSVHYIGLSCAFVSAQYRTTQFNHSTAISWLHKRNLIEKQIKYLHTRNKDNKKNSDLWILNACQDHYVICRLHCWSDTFTTSALCLSVRAQFIFTDYKEYLW